MIRSPGLLALSAASLFALAACQTGPDGITSPTAAVRGFYGPYTGDFRAADAARLSPGLAAEVEKAKANEVESAALTKAGPNPTDKPNILEGEIFAGLNEPVTNITRRLARRREAGQRRRLEDRQRPVHRRLDRPDQPARHPSPVQHPARRALRGTLRGVHQAARMKSPAVRMGLTVPKVARAMAAAPPRPSGS